MGKLPGIPHLHAVRALEKAGFRILRQGKHIVMTDGQRILTIPRHNPVNALTMGHHPRCRTYDRRISEATLNGQSRLAYTTRTPASACSCAW